MSLEKRIEFGVFEEIKQNFDPAFIYLIFESPMISEGHTNFEDIISFIGRSIKGKIKHEIFLDEVHKNQILVFKLKLKQKESIAQELSSMSLSKNIKFFIYEPP